MIGKFVKIQNGRQNLKIDRYLANGASDARKEW